MTDEVEIDDNDEETESLFPKHPVQVAHLVHRLTQHSGTTNLPSPEDRTGQAILGDALLCYCVENVRHQEGRDKPVSRVFPTHFFSSWIDLPRSVANLRMVPELLVHLLSAYSESWQPSQPYAINQGIAKNRLLSLLGKGVIETETGSINLMGDQFDRQVPLALDQLLTARIALQCQGAPSTLAPRAKAEIPRQQPICQRAVRVFAEDFDALLAGFGEAIPRPSLVPMLESCIGLGLSNLVLSTALMLEKWEVGGQLPTFDDQHPQLCWSMFPLRSTVICKPSPRIRWMTVYAESNMCRTFTLFMPTSVLQ